MEQDFSKMKEADLVVKYNNLRFSRGINTNIFVIGLSGTGKSSTSIRIAELIGESKDFEIQIFIVDSLLGLLKSIRKSKEGDIIVVEETSVLFPSRRSMAQENVSINKIMDTCRKRLLTIISNAPLWGSIDSHLKSMGHILIETLRINKTQGVVISKFHRLQTNPLSSKTYRHTMQREGMDVSRMFTKMPNEARWNEYETSKDKFMEELYQTLESQQIKKKKKQDKENFNVEPKIETLTALELQIHELVHVKGLKQSEAAKKLKKDPAQICRTIKKIKRISDFAKENEEIDVKNLTNLPIK